MERLSAEDQLILWPDRGVAARHRCSRCPRRQALLDSDGRFRIEAAKQAVEGRLHLLPAVPSGALRTPARPRRSAVGRCTGVRPERSRPRRATSFPGDEATLLRAVERLRRRRLDKSRPLWEMWFLTGLPDQRIGLFVRLHHVVADGIAGVAELGALLDTAPSSATAPAQPWTPEPWPSARHLLLDNLQRRIAKLGSGLKKVSHPGSDRCAAHEPQCPRCASSSPKNQDPKRA